MPQRTTAERPVTPTQARIHREWASNPGMSLTQLAIELGVSRKRVSQALAVVRTKHLHQGVTQ